MKLLILEDEIPAFEKIESYVKQVFPKDLDLTWVKSIKEGLDYFRQNDPPDLIISDIELLDGVSFSLFEQIKTSSPIIFCTAYDKYLLEAFKTNGIGYLLKPYTLEGFKETIEKYSALFKKSEVNLDSDILTKLKGLMEGQEKEFKKRFTIKKKQGIKLLKVDDIVMIQANGDFCQALDTSKAKHLINENLGSIEQKLDPEHFFRINRSEIINIAYIENIEAHFKNRLAIKMQCSQETYFSSSAKTPNFRAWLDK